MLGPTSERPLLAQSGHWLTYLIRPFALACGLLVFSTTVSLGALFDPAYRAIIPADGAQRLLAPSCATDGPTVAKLKFGWQPTEQEIDSLEQRLGVAIMGAIRSAKWIGPVTQIQEGSWESIRNHVRQYAGVYADGHKYIYVRAAPIEAVDFDGPHLWPYVDRSDWHSGAPVGGFDMGPSVFTVLYDPEAGKFGTFHFCNTIAGYNAP
jgi:hypothetical protein